jgi:C_GCAxxG_C_C family probable redox protein
MRQDYIDKAVLLFDEGYACAQAVLLAFSSSFGLDESTAKLISSTFGGGMGRLRLTCGAVTGAFMVLGLAYGNTDPRDIERKLDSYAKVRALKSEIVKIHGTIVCAELLEKHASESDVDERKHHPLICRSIVGDVAGLLFDMVEDRLQDE